MVLDASYRSPELKEPDYGSGGDPRVGSVHKTLIFPDVWSIIGMLSKTMDMI